MSSRTGGGRHRAPASEQTASTSFILAQLPRPHLPRTHLPRPQLAGSARPVAKAGAVFAVSGGLVASLGMQANAAPITTTPLPSSASISAVTVASHVSSAAVTSVIAFGGPVALRSALVASPQSPQVGAGQFGELGFTAKAQPAAKPRAATASALMTARSTRPFDQRSSRSATRLSVDVTPDETVDETTPATTEAPAESPVAPAPVEVDPAPSTIEAGSPGSAQFGASVLAIAARYNGIAYRYGGTTPAGFDCSGFTSYVLAQVGIDLTRTSGSQRAETTRISRSEAVAGDLVFMPGHVGIYAGNGMMWDSPRSGKDVSKRSVYSSSATFGRVS